MRFLPALAAAGVATLFCATARAEDPKACTATATILTLSDAVLDQRDTLPRLKARGFGAETAYLKIRYGALSPEAAIRLAHGLREAGVREAIDLAGALDALHGGFDALPKETANSAQISGLISTLRAVLDHGDAEMLLSATAALSAKEQVSVIERVVPAVVDWPDDRKAALAAAAGRHKLVLLQAGLAATQRDPKAWEAFAATVSEPDRLQGLAQAWSWAPALVGNPALPRAGQDAASQAMRKTYHAALIAAARLPERDFLMTYLNYTGDIQNTSKAAEAVVAEVDAGRIRPEGAMDAAWLKAYRTLATVTADTAKLDAVLVDIPFIAGSYMRSADRLSVRDVIDRLVAVEALAPFVKDGSPMPDMPMELSAKFRAKWPLWTELAQALKTSPLTPFAKDPAKAPIVAELLLAAGDHARLADFVLAVEPVDARLAMATDFAMRLDRTCASYMHFPTEAMTLSGQPIFRFDPAK